MADPQSNARPRADAGTPTSGVIHVRTRLTADFTVLSNALARHRGSAVTIGVAVYIASLPDGSPVTINALCEHFTEGEILISRALRELERLGYLERRRERGPGGHVRTRTYFYDVPGGGQDDHPPQPPRPSRPPRPPKPGRSRRQSAVAQVTPPSAVTEAAVPAPAPGEGAAAPSRLADADPRAVAVLTALRRVDPRLVLSEREAARLAPAVAQWLAAGVGAHQITELLTARLPDRFLARPAGILAFRLRETPLPAPPSLAPPGERLPGVSTVPAASAAPAVPVFPVVLPFQTCDGCERAFRAPEPGRCRDCRSANRLRAAG
ncbi:hypothetical protein ACF061_10835 [Streptomyces sp. NPDC015220]|uniref:hypothetical protein n=1 Tax=Streptomyces sp. NPDC015220 TaxID=3364947 RepID=UPI0036FA3F0D